MKSYFVCKIIGDGLSPETAFRPAIQDVLDPATGFRAFNTSSVIAIDEFGQPVLEWCLVIASGKDHSLVEGNDDIDALPLNAELASIKVSSLDTVSKVDMAQKLQSRGIDTSFISNADGIRSIVETLGKLHEPSFNFKAFDVEE